MGWASCGTDSAGRRIGYAHVATCDEPECQVRIDRGLGYACGGMHGTEGRDGQPACEGYFCGEHRVDGVRCERCVRLTEEADDADGAA